MRDIDNASAGIKLCLALVAALPRQPSHQGYGSTSRLRFAAVRRACRAEAQRRRA